MKVLVAGIVVILLVATVVTLTATGSDTRRVTAYFDRTVSLYKGSEVRVMGVNIGTVTAVVPEGDRVRVAMEYDDEYKLPADAKAAIITPDAHRRSLRAGRPGVHRRRRDGRQRQDRAGGDRHTGGARPHLQEPLRPDRRPSVPTVPTRTAA